MAPKGGSVIKEPRSAVEIAESIENCQGLVRRGDVQVGKAITDRRVVRGRMAELEQELITRGMGSMAVGGQKPC